VICPNCEHGLDEKEGLKYCPYCGRRLGKKSKSRSIWGALAAGTAAALLVALAAFAFFKLASLYIGASKQSASAEPMALSLRTPENGGVFYPGDSFKLSMEIYPENAKDMAVTWSSSDESVALVDNMGNVRLVSEGDAVVTATFENGVSADISLRAGKRPYKISFNQSRMTVEIGTKTALVPVISPADAEYSGVEWRSSDRSVASVDDEGNFVAHSEGKTTITATVAGDVTARLNVFVYRYLFDIFIDYIYENGEYDDDYKEYFITLNWSSSHESDGTQINKHTYLSFYPGSDRVILYCDVFNEDGSVYYESLVYFTREDRKYAKFQFYCECEDYSGTGVDTIPMVFAEDHMTFDAVGRLDLENYTTQTKLLFENYEGEDSFEQTALKITNELIASSMLLLKEQWTSFGLGYSIAEVVGLKSL
jgi:hypothetical protein